MKTLNAKNIRGLFLILFIMINLMTAKLFACNPGFTWVQTANLTISFTDTTAGLDANKHFTWSFGSSLENPVHVFSAPGTYVVYMHVIDSTVSCNSYFTDTVVVTGCNLAATMTCVNSTCASCPNGAAWATVTGGTAPFTYTWSPSGGPGATASGLLYGNYTCCITDAAGCTVCVHGAVADTTICNMTAAGYQYHWASCANCNDGVGHVYANGGTAPFSYLWMPSGQTTQFATSLSPGVYTCCISDVNNCHACTTVTIHDSVVCNMTIGAYQYQMASCPTCSDGIGHAYVTGGTAPFTYLWSPSGQTTQMATGLLPGTYSVCATDANGCHACNYVIIHDSTVSPCNITLSVYQYLAASCSTCANGIAHAFATGGSAPYHYVWTPSGDTSNMPNNLAPGNYYCCVTDANGCTACHSVVITYTTYPCNVTVGAYQYHPATCYTCANGVAHAYATGGTSPYSYVWTPTGGTGNVASGLNPGIYTVCVTDAHSCSACTTVSIGDSTNTTGCQAYFYFYPDTAMPHHYYAINYTTGTAPFTYNWAWGDATYSTGPYPSHIYANPGVYTICLQITDATGCTSTYCRTDSVARMDNMMVYVNVIAASTLVTEVLPANNSITIYPNPAHDVIIVHHSTDLMKIDECKISITDVLGRELYNKTITVVDENIDISKWSNGLYLYNIINSMSTIQGKFVKE